MISAKPWRAEAMARLLLGIIACVLAGWLLQSVLDHSSASGKTGAKLFYPAAAAAFGCLAGALALLRQAWRLDNWPRRVLGAVSCLYASFLLGAWVQHGAGAAEVSTRHMLLSILSFQGAGIVLIACLLREYGEGWAEAFGLRNQWARALLLGAIMASLFLPVGWALQEASALVLKKLPGLGLQPEVQPAVQVLQQAASWPSRSALGLLTILLAPVGEELLFRGTFYPWIKQAGFPRLALWGTSVGFAAIHLNAGIFVPLLVLALILTALYERTNNLLAPIAAHSVFNALNFAVLYLYK
jgi:membrane protease YdiL (CAAX protease family)